MSAARPHVVVIGAGAFGGWTALELRRRGAAVTLIDAWGPGHVRSSSGGETRVIRAGYGSRAHYTRMAVRALALWRAREAEWGRRFLHDTGVLWMFGGDRAFADATRQALHACGAAVREFTPSEAERAFPQISFEDVSTVFLEPDAGWLLARRACEHVAERLVAAGGVYRHAAAVPPAWDGGTATRLQLQEGDPIAGDVFVFACGPWLGAMFPDVIGSLVVATRQEVHYFGTPAGDPRFTDEGLPAWIDFRQRQIYGIPGNAHRGFKVADDTTGPLMDPTTGDRNATPASVSAARAFLAQRFPALADAPHVGSEVCQYESSPDADFIIDRHPGAANVWLLGGGSGHGFKMGPAVGELVASLILEERDPDPVYRLSRFAAPPPDGWQPKWS